ncbi:hypothetical protein [Mycolicibacterium farcinogenes]|uniref:Uncharacterized protein n=1 Tax=Mycolicibacterium farcinogenes TaxID=1802 RepID=A0ACD1FDB1_MYCFR|nr:hypothetical protein [Mycolicibacterium farcinogenes]QZH65015.1 hypothetical protein K6L26_23890 [Mycolicibacterium farcinogenes]
MTDPDGLAEDLWGGIEESKRLGYSPARFIQLVQQHGAVEATRRVVDTDAPADGFVTLAYLMTPPRPDFTSEQLVLNYPGLFSDEVVRKARSRLNQG